MSLAVSTQLYDAGRIGQIWALVEKLQDEKIGIEIFPEFNLPCFEDLLQEELPRLAGRAISFHGPYWGIEPCVLPTDPAFQIFMEQWGKTLAYARDLGAEYVVYHLYNAHFSACEREEKRRLAFGTLPYIREMAAEYGVKLALENTETSRSEGENLLTQQEFIDLARSLEDMAVLIDTGHVACAGWNMAELIGALSDKIVGYHLHSNDGKQDIHCRILGGTVDMEAFAAAAREHTPHAIFTLEYNPRLGITDEEVCADIAWLKARGLG